MPGARGVAVVDTRSWTVVTTIDLGRVPSRLALQPDEAYLWVADDRRRRVDRRSSTTLRVVSRLATGRGPHQIVFSDDNRFAFVANGAAGTVSVVDIRQLQTVEDVALGAPIASMAYASRARVAYVTLPDAGVVAGIDAATHRVIARIPTAPGAGTLAFAPDGRLGFVLNARTNTVSIVDAALQPRRAHGGGREGARPDRLLQPVRLRAPSRQRDRRDDRARAVSTSEGGSTSQLDFPGGQHPGGGGSRVSLAPSIVRSGTDNAVLVANAQDKAIYYYQEGMAAPMGQFSNYDREPTATMIVDRSLRETTPGGLRFGRAPAGGGRLRRARRHRQTARSCTASRLSIAAAAGPTPAAGLTAKVEPLVRDNDRADPARRMRIALRLTDAGGAPLAGVADAQVLVVAAGVWQVRDTLRPEAKGIYALTVVPPAPGLYDVYFTAPSRQMPYQRVFTFEAAADTRRKARPDDGRRRGARRGAGALGRWTALGTGAAVHRLVPGPWTRLSPLHLRRRAQRPGRHRDPRRPRGPAGIADLPVPRPRQLRRIRQLLPLPAAARTWRLVGRHGHRLPEAVRAAPGLRVLVGAGRADGSSSTAASSRSRPGAR